MKSLFGMFTISNIKSKKKKKRIYSGRCYRHNSIRKLIYFVGTKSADRLVDLRKKTLSIYAFISHHSMATTPHALIISIRINMIFDFVSSFWFDFSPHLHTYQIHWYRILVYLLFGLRFVFKGSMRRGKIFVCSLLIVTITAHKMHAYTGTTNVSPLCCFLAALFLSMQFKCNVFI